MRRILFSETDFASLPNPPAGFKYIGFDGPNFSEKDENGSTTPTGGGAGLTDITYSAISTAIDENALTPGSYYRITDFKTCYDQPNYNINRNAIYTGNYKVGNTHSIIVFAISSDKLSVDAWQPDFPKDRIKYDINYSTTYTTGGTAFGRITERVDEWNNRTDYDHREVLFRRYKHYYPDLTPLSGTIDMIESGTVSGINTQFNVDFSVDDYLFLSEDLGFVYKITQISSSQSMSVTGSYIPNVSGNYHKGYRTSDSNLDGYIQYYQNNVDGSEDYEEFHTFKLEDEDIINNKFGDFYSLTNWDEPDFDLPNNVFGEDVISSIFGHSFINNTFVDDVEETRIGDYCEKNIYYGDDDFDDNVIGNFFQNNTILSRFDQNSIKNGFQNNYIKGNCENNFIGDNFSDNRINNNYEDNNVGNYFQNNKIYENFDDNKIGNGFNNNTIENSFYDNTINVFFEYNHTYSSFNKNTIGNSCAQNDIYSDFYENNIGLYFGGNVIGDSGNLGDINFYRNRIGNNFNDNNIRQDFQNNQIGNNFQENNLYGDFSNNVIVNYFNSNSISHGFFRNHIGNYFQDNDYIGDYFQNNKIGEYFENNYYIYNNFTDNSIGNEFKNNTLGDIQYFNWNNTSIENLTDRNYDTLGDALYNDNEDEIIDRVILGKELIMHFSRNSGTLITDGELIVGETYEITNYQGTDDFTDVADIQSGVINTNGCVFIATGPTVSNWSSESELTELTSYDEYHKVKFTQWTQNNNGGGFSYERTKVYPTSEPTVYFTKLNYASKVDVIIPGRLEIKRNNNGAIYNDVLENNFNNNSSPQGTEWNSIYTQGDFNFSNNEIKNVFKGNYILDSFDTNKIGNAFGDDEFFSANTISGPFINNTIGTVFIFNDVNYFYSNKIGSFFVENNIDNDFISNDIGDNFTNNNISSDFRHNDIGDYFEDNDIAPDFRNNKIGKYFRNNTIAEGFGFGSDESQTNIIGDYFEDNNIGEYFYNNKVASYFQYNDVGYYFQRNNIDTPISEKDFIVNYGNILAFTYQSSGTTSTPGFYNSLSGTINGHGESATFGITVSGGTISVIGLVYAGNQYEVGDTIVISGNSIEGQTGVIDGFTLIDNPTGLLDGTYTGLTVSGGSGSNALFDIEIFGGTVSTINLNDGGGSYIIGNTVSIIGSYFGGTNSVDDITINVDSIYSDDVTITVTAVSATPSVYETYNCQIFERRGGNKRLSFYDENDFLTIKNINE